jgi:hypothetical protein
MFRDALLLCPNVLLYALILHGLNLAAEREVRFINVPTVMAVVIWLLLWIFTGIIFARKPWREISHFSRCMVPLILFWPLLGTGMALAIGKTSSFDVGAIAGSYLFLGIIASILWFPTHWGTALLVDKIVRRREAASRES